MFLEGQGFQGAPFCQTWLYLIVMAFLIDSRRTKQGDYKQPEMEQPLMITSTLSHRVLSGTKMDLGE